MFTGIIETIGIVKQVVEKGSNRVFWIKSSISSKLKIDQSVSHDGVCLTVEEIKGGKHRVTAIDETLRKTSLGQWQPGRKINLERSVKMNSRMDGHFVQGHCDTTAVCKNIIEKDGSWEFEFQYPGQFSGLLIEKGSVSVNGTSLTVFSVSEKNFKIAVIPYTYNHTNINTLVKESHVNIEFDMIGKYINRKLSLHK